MVEINIRDVLVHFPFEPYDLQKVYMEKVIECLQNGSNGVLESPTGTGKTLSLLCSTLGWLMVKKQQAQINKIQDQPVSTEKGMNKVKLHSLVRKNDSLDPAAALDNVSWSVPHVIYASRTHSQLNQAIQELKRTHYKFLKAAVMGSRDQMCINAEVMKEESNANKIHMCQHKVLSRTCSFYLNIDNKREHPLVQENSVLDIEDLVKVGKKIKACPYYLSKSMHQAADITFMPYNYLLDPKARTANKIDLTNTVIILDEAHNVEKTCEESVSIQIKNTDLAVAIDEVTRIMKHMVETADFENVGDSQPKDFTAEDLADLKEYLLALEKAFQNIKVTSEEEGSTYPGAFIFDFLSEANITKLNYRSVTGIIDSLLQFLNTLTNSSFSHKGEGLQKIVDLLQITFSTSNEEQEEQVKKCFKVHIAIEADHNKGYKAAQNNWLSAKTKEKTAVKVLSYWCFSPSFGMKQLVDKNVHSIILTSGTLAPLKPLLIELGIPVSVQLENPHVVSASQICVQIIPNGSDNQVLNSSYENRNNPKYIQSLGCTILSLCSVVPNGLLVFFPSYPVMNKCQESWQCSGLWQQMNRKKIIFVEPRSKDAFSTVMTEFYNRINDATENGAIFMAVCRGKVSEGLDFADMNGRAVVITGLPFPPLRDNKVILKKKYLQENRTSSNEFLSGDEWYRLEAIRAVNQAIGRVIRHKNDYGAILLCDTRFQNPSLKNQLSKWIQGYIKCNDKYGRVIGDLRMFFRNAERTLPLPSLKPLSKDDEIVSDSNLKTDIIDLTTNTKPAFTKTINTVIDDSKLRPSFSLKNIEKVNEAVSWSSMAEYKYVPKSKLQPNQSTSLIDGLGEESKSIDFNDVSSATCSISSGDSNDVLKQPHKKRKLKILQTSSYDQNCIKETTLSTMTKCKSLIAKPLPENRHEYLILLKENLTLESYNKFLIAINAYQMDKNYNKLIAILDEIFSEKKQIHYLLKGLVRFLKDPHKKNFELYCKNNVDV